MNEPDNRLSHLKQHIDHAADQLAQSSNTDDGLGSLIYLGNHHDSVPRELITDPHLESGEIHTWTLMKIQVINPAIPTSIPGQDQLAQHLKCSRPVVSRHLQVLRALRWITLCKEVRAANGQYKGYVYAQHDKPLNLNDTLFLDEHYIQFLESPNKADSFKRLRTVKQAVLMHMDFQVVTDTAFVTPTVLEAATSHLLNKDKEILQTSRACPEQRIEDIPDDLYFKSAIKRDKQSDESEKHHVKVMHRVKYINTVKTDENNHVNNINMDESPLQRDSNHVNIFNTVKIENHVNFNMVDGSSSCIYITTTTKQKQIQKLRFPKALDENRRLKVFAVKLLDPLSLNDQQFILDYLTDRLKAAKQGTCKPVNDLIAYLRWIINSKQNNTLPPSAFGIRDALDASPAKSVEWKQQIESPDDIAKNHQQSMRQLEKLKNRARCEA